MARFTHDDPRYQIALREMAANLNRLIDAKGWTTKADFVRATQLHMPEGGEFRADLASNYTNGKNRPNITYQRAMAAALGVDIEDFMPPYLRDGIGADAPVEPLVTEIVGTKRYILSIRREMTLGQALRMVDLLDEIEREQAAPLRLVNGGKNDAS